MRFLRCIGASNSFKNRARKHRQQDGFTLVELMFVVMISGIMILMLANAYAQYLKQERIDVTRERMERLTETLELYYLAAGKLPCPGFRDLEIQDEDFGVPFTQCSDVGFIKLALPQIQIGAPRDPVNPGDPRSCYRGVCWLPGASDTGVPSYDEGNSIVTGVVPLEKLRELDGSLPNDIAIDGYGNQFTYAMSIRTNEVGHPPRSGVIGALDEFGNPTASINNDGDFVLISHGPDGRGAYHRGGGEGRRCSTYPDGSNSTLDGDNCDTTDGVFTQSLGMTLAFTPDAGDPGLNANPKYSDDRVYFFKAPIERIWRNVQTSPGQPARYAPAIAGGAIGIKDQPDDEDAGKPYNSDPDPDKKLVLDIGGNARVDGTLRVDEICTTDGSYCFDVEMIADGTPASPIRCPDGQLMTGIADGKALCELAPDFTEPAGVECPADYWLYGANPDGSIVCKEDSDSGTLLVVGP